ncbi:MAG TPA: folate hydrolase [Syntrophobacteraceae bacterium]|nr:folate hydrolase [Syntrophobacteraceae bacterium]
MRLLFILLATAAGGSAAEVALVEPASLEGRLDATIDPAELRNWMEFLTSEPSHVGSEFDKTIAEWTLAKFKSFGWDAHIERYDVLHPTPVKESVTLIGGKPFMATLTEPWTKQTPKPKSDPLPAYVAYQGDGDVTAPLVYVNFGLKDDYEALQRLGVSVKGRIVIARYGAGWRGLKPRLAQEHGALGCILFSDPQNDGYSTEYVYPDGPARPPHGFQRGSVQDITLASGDPTTVGFIDGKDGKRISRDAAPGILKIPSLPISYADAEVFLKALGGQVVPPNWRGALPITYRVGPSEAKVHLVVKSDWGLKPVYNVIARIEGSTYPNQWVLRGNHHDGWVFGATDPQAGHVALLAEAKAIGALVKSGWKPKRTIIYASWDGEEPGLLGSSEWAEDHAAELKQKAVIYINSDTNSRGFLDVAGSQDFSRLLSSVAGDVIDPETKVSVGARLRAKLRLAAEGVANETAKFFATQAADPSADLPIDALGTGSDYTALLQHLGVPALNLAYEGEAEWNGVYHSIYDSIDHHCRFVDPDFIYDALLAKTAGRLVLRAAESDLPLQNPTGLASAINQYLKEIKKLADDRRDAARLQTELLHDAVYTLAADPTKSSGLPTVLQPVPQFDFKPLDAATARLSASAKAYENAVAQNGANLATGKRSKLLDLMRDIDQMLISDAGLPGRPWYKHMIYAPGRQTGYGAKTLPGVREAIEDQRWNDADRYINLTAAALEAYAARLDAATELLTAP